MTQRRMAAILAVTIAPVGCAATSGQEWLNSPIDPAAPAQATSELDVSAVSTVEARPRLRHTVTLGESYASNSPGATAGTAPSSGDPAQVHVRTYVPVTINNYAPYGSAAYYDAARGVASAPRSAELQPGQEFPSPPSYGPTFPYHSSPASPWPR